MRRLVPLTEEFDRHFWSDALPDSTYDSSVLPVLLKSFDDVATKRRVHI
jgi:hypothetical protein